jgi:predicted transcriptional regulator
MITLGEIMSRHYEFIRTDDSAQAALRKMESLNLIMLPVCENDRLVGVLDAAQASRRLRSENLEPAQVRVGDIMSSEVLTGSEQGNVQEFVHVMRQRGIPLLPIVDSNRHIVGVFSLGGPWKRGSKGKEAGVGAHGEPPGSEQP